MYKILSSNKSKARPIFHFSLKILFWFGKKDLLKPFSFGLKTWKINGKLESHSSTCYGHAGPLTHTLSLSPKKKKSEVAFLFFQFLVERFYRWGRQVPLNGWRAIVPNVIEAVEVARQRGNLVIWVCTLFRSIHFSLLLFALFICLINIVRIICFMS